MQRLQEPNGNKRATLYLFGRRVARGVKRPSVVGAREREGDERHVPMQYAKDSSSSSSSSPYLLFLPYMCPNTTSYYVVDVLINKWKSQESVAHHPLSLLALEGLDTQQRERERSQSN